MYFLYPALVFGEMFLPEGTLGNLYYLECKYYISKSYVPSSACGAGVSGIGNIPIYFMAIELLCDMKHWTFG